MKKIYLNIIIAIGVYLGIAFAILDFSWIIKEEDGYNGLRLLFLVVCALAAKHLRKRN
jgi:hypothetical protein